MRMTRLILASIAFMASMASPAFSKELGGNAGDIWNFGAGARSLGVGNAFIELSDDATAGYWNPARLSYLTRSNFNFLHASLFEGAAYEYIGFAYPSMALGSFGLNVVRLAVGGIEQRDDGNNLMNSGYSFASTGYSLSYGNRFGQKVAFGGSVKNLTRTLPGASSSIMSFDLSADYKAFRFGEVGVVLRDMFYVASGTDDELPLNATLGASYGLFAGALKTSAQYEQQGGVVRLGMEYGMGPAALRMGLGGVGDASAGFGMRFKSMQFDYAIALHELGPSNRVSMGMNFGADKSVQRRDIARRFFERAKEAYRDGRLVKASRFLEKGLSFNPNDALLQARLNKLENLLLLMGREELKRPRAESHPNDKKKYVFAVRGLTDYIEGNLDGALLLLRQALAIDPNDQRIRNVYDKLLSEAGREKDKNDPILSPEANIGVKLAEAERYFRSGKFEMSVKVCEEAVKLDPGNALAFERLGSSYFALGLKEKAVEMWLRALELNPDNKALREFMSRYWFKK